LKESSRIDNALDFETLNRYYEELSSNIPVWESLPAFKRPSAALSTLNTILGTNYKPFEYYGHKSASTVFVIYGSVESELFAKEVQEYASQNLSVGVIVTRIPLPFDSDEFLSSVPKSAQSLVVIGQSLDNKSSILKTNVTATVFLNGLSRVLKVSEFIYSPTFIWSSIAVEQIIGSFVVLPKKQPDVLSNFGSSVPYGNFILWSLDNGEHVEVGSKLAHSFSLDQNSLVKFRSKYDNVVAGGVYQAEISSTKLNSNVQKERVGAIDSADLILVQDLEILKNFNVVKTLKQKGVVLIITKEELPKDLSSFVESLPVQFRRNIAKNENKLVFIDLHSIGDLDQTKGRTGLIAIQSIFWKYSSDQLNINDIVRRILHASGSDIELLPAVLTSIIEEKVFTGGVKEVHFDPKWAELPLEEAEVSLPIFLTESSFEPNAKSVPEPARVESSSYVDVVKKFAFNESFKTDHNSLRPDLPARNFIVKVQENRRVTPDDYSRNIFHIEFDVTGTGLTYDIGEALGVHGKNDKEEVERFIEFYGLNPDQLVQVPNRDDDDLIEIRTVFQAFTDNLDILGKPGKKFYESLAEFATEETEKKKLTLLGSSDGTAELKKYQDEEFYSYTDIFELFPSAKPSLPELFTIIPPLKRREYSIASSQKMHPNAVHLLIVVVDWVDNRKRKRFGQCSRYLSELAIGTELVVSVKPSVMKLPPLSKQPIIMSGLGTGLAPFKAFVEEKIWQQQQGLEIGKIFLFLGARHKKEEYLYGELWEAYKEAGIITHIGAAFSRDQPDKIYIQDRIREVLPELKTAIMEEEGSFYLCGPTWPVGDITYELSTIVGGDDAVEELKENSRYILEVY
jgi:sulfite reductase (NADPH) flavoprotein alpha-component